MGELRKAATGYNWQSIPNDVRAIMLKEDARIEALEARVAAADKLADAASEQVQYMQMCNDTGDLERNLRAALAAYQATKEVE